MRNLAWYTLHAATFAFGAAMLIVIAWEVFTTGELHRAASSAGNYSAAFVVSMLLINTAIAISGFRSMWRVERDV